MFDVFIIFNSQGRSKGMAVVHFQRTDDALEARRKYDGKIIDGRKCSLIYVLWRNWTCGIVGKPLKIELIVDPPVVKPKSLAERISNPRPPVPYVFVHCLSYISLQSKFTQETALPRNLLHDNK